MSEDESQAPDALLALLGQILEVDPRQLNDESTYRDAPKWDSLRLIIIANVLEQTYGLSLSDADMASLTSVRAIRTLLGARAAAAPASGPAQERRGFSAAEPPETLRARATRRLSLPEIYELAEILRDADRARWTGPTARIAVVGGLTTDFVAAAVACAAFQEGVLAEVYQAPYGSLVQEILDVSSGLYKFDPDYVVLVPDARDWVGVYAPNVAAEEVEQRLDENVRQFAGLWSHLVANAKCTVFQHVLTPPLRDLRGLAERSLAASAPAQIQRLNALLFEAGRGRVNWIELDRLSAAKGLAAFASAKHYFASRLPFDPKFLPDYLYFFRAAWRNATFRPKKVLALDLDNTLWGGVIGDDGAEGIKLGPGSPAGEAFADWGGYIRELGARGVVLAICSKNNPELAAEGLNHPSAVLKREDFAAAQISWDDKATSLRRLAAELNVGLESFVFVDDNPFECELVREQLPDAAVVEIGDDPSAFIDILESGRWFDLPAYAPEDFARAQAYQARAAVEAERAGASDIEGYLRGLKMAGALNEAKPANLTRLAQMEQKTNQFNTMTRRFGEDDVRRYIEGADTLALAFDLRDRHADHGLVSSLMATRAGDELTIDNWLMSCRVFSRTAEEYIRNELVRLAASRGIAKIVGLYAPTKRNGVVADLYDRLGFENLGEGRWRLDVASATPLKTFVGSSLNGEAPAAAPPPAVTPHRDEKSLADLIAAGEAASQRQDYAAALATWREVGERDLGNIHAHIKAIESLRTLRRFDDADSFAEARIRAHPGDPGLRFQYASNAAVAERWEEAHARWRQARELFFDFPEPPFGMAEALQRLGRLDEAESLLAENIRRFPEHTWSGMLLAELLGQRGDWRDSAQRLEDLAERLPDRAEIGVRWCIALINAGDIPAGRRVIDDYAKRFSGDVVVRDYQAWAASCDSDWNAALGYADSVLASGGTGHTVLRARQARRNLDRASDASLVIYGNCQGDVLEGLIARLKRLYPKFDVVPILGHLPEEMAKLGDRRLKNAAMYWEQHDERAEAPVRDALRQALPKGVPTLRYPSLSLFSLWPFNWPDPRSRPEPPRFPEGRYPYEGDSVAQAVAKEGLSGERAYTRYMELSHAKLGNLQSQFDRDVATLRKRDSRCDVKMADYVLENYRKYPMFYTWGHVAGDAMAEIALQLLSKSRAALGGDNEHDRVQLGILHTAIEPFWMPIHPEVARWHRLEYCRDENAKFNIHGHWWTFKEFIVKYIEYDESW